MFSICNNVDTKNDGAKETKDKKENEDYDMRNPVKIDSDFRPMNVIYDVSMLKNDTTNVKENVWQQIWARMQMSSCFIFVKNSGFRQLCT